MDAATRTEVARREGVRCMSVLLERVGLDGEQALQQSLRDTPADRAKLLLGIVLLFGFTPRAPARTRFSICPAADNRL